MFKKATTLVNSIILSGEVVRYLEQKTIASDKELILNIKGLNPAYLEELHRSGLVRREERGDEFFYSLNDIVRKLI
jgi:predicted transcriptional regulator